MAKAKSGLEAIKAQLGAAGRTELTPAQTAFMANAEPVSVTLGDSDLKADLLPRVFSTGSFGWYGTETAVNVQGIETKVAVTITVPGSKALVKSQREAMKAAVATIVPPIVEGING
jgi:hypothetical protein